jgi:hypothetical protein
MSTRSPKECASCRSLLLIWPVAVCTSSLTTQFYGIAITIGTQSEDTLTDVARTISFDWAFLGLDVRRADVAYYALETQAQAPTAAAPVPEPSTIALLSLGPVQAVSLRRRARGRSDGV